MFLLFLIEKNINYVIKFKPKIITIIPKAEKKCLYASALEEKHVAIILFLHRKEGKTTLQKDHSNSLNRFGLMR